MYHHIGLFIRMIGSLLVFLILPNGCGPDTNILGITTPPAQTEQFYAQLEKAQVLYDQGRYDEAAVAAIAANEADPGSSQAAVLVGWSLMGKVGIVPFDFVRDMLMEQSGASSGTAEGGTTSDASGSTEQSQSGEGASGESSDGDFLGQFTDLIGLDDSALYELGEFDTMDPELPIIVPYCAGLPRINLELLENVNRAIAAVCPFIPHSARVGSDSRHDCLEPNASDNVDVFWLWALSHLVEALAFYKVLNYSTQADGTSNLQARAAKLQSRDVTNPLQALTFVDELAAFASTVARMMPPSGVCSESYPQSQIDGMANDIKAVERAFLVIGTVPENVISSLSEMTKALSEAGGENGLRGFINKGISGPMKETIEVIPKALLPEQKFTSLCDSYTVLSGSKKDGPKNCQD